MQISHFKKQVIFVCHHSKAVVRCQTDDQEPFSAAFQNHMVPQSRNRGSIVVGDIGAEQGKAP